MLITVVEGIWVNESVRKSYNLVINGYRVMKSILPNHHALEHESKIQFNVANYLSGLLSVDLHLINYSKQSIIRSFPKAARSHFQAKHIKFEEANFLDVHLFCGHLVSQCW